MDIQSFLVYSIITYRGHLALLAHSHAVVEVVLFLSLHSIPATVCCVLGWPFLLYTNRVPDCLEQLLDLTPAAIKRVKPK